MVNVHCEKMFIAAGQNSEIFNFSLYQNFSSEMSHHDKKDAAICKFNLICTALLDMDINCVQVFEANYINSILK